ncbi:MAG: 30S ribosomal protein S30e [Candidatus Bathyarchaeia archaeon]
MPTHGSLTKAGKVRSQTPRVASRKKKSLGPRRRNLRNYQRLLSGRRRFGRRRRRRRRRR